MNMIKLLSAGAALGLMRTVGPEFEREADCVIKSEFGAVGAMKKRFVDGAECDVLISSERIFEELVETSSVQRKNVHALGWVGTGIGAVEDGIYTEIESVDSLREILGIVTDIYLPDMNMSTAGRHMKKIFDELGLRNVIKDKLREFRNGAEAMRAMASEKKLKPIGFTQSTEILYTAGVKLVGLLPKKLALNTLYEISVMESAKSRELSDQFVGYMVSDRTTDERKSSGFKVM